MEIKKYNEYSDDEKSELLFHWWHYYGKTVCSLGVMRRFTQMVYDDVDKMFDIGLFSFVKGDNGKGFINAIKCGSVDEYCDMVKRVSTNEEYKRNNEKKKEEFIELLVSSYEMREEEIISHDEYINGIIDVIDSSDIVLTSDKVHELYKKCLFKDCELENGKPVLPFSVGEGVRTTVVFNSERLEENRDEVGKMVGELFNIDEGNSFLELCFDKNMRFWTGDLQTIDMLVQLGVATGDLKYVVPKRELNATMPRLMKNKEKSDVQVDAKQPKEYKKVLDNFSDNNNN